MTSLRYIPLAELGLVALVALAITGLAVAPAVRRGDYSGAARRALRLLLAGAVVAVLAATLLRGGGGAGLNLTPGAGIRAELGNINRELGLVNVLGNVAMFVPVGLLFPVAFRMRLGPVVGVAALPFVAIELLQLLIGRSADIDDVLLNSAGAAIGALAGVALAHRLQERRTGRMLAWSMAVSGPLLALVYGLESLDLADAMIDSGRRGASEPWFPAVLGVVLAAMAPGALRRTRGR